MTSLKPVRPVLHSCTVLLPAPPHLRSPTAQAGGMQVAPVLASHSSGVTQVATSSHAVRVELHFCSFAPLQFLSPMLQSGDPHPPTPLIMQISDVAQVSIIVEL